MGTSFGIALVLAAVAAATPQANTDTQVSPPVGDGTQPALIANVKIQPGDSDLVRAAKMTVASRINSHQKAVVIDESYMRRVNGGRLSAPTGPAALPASTEARSLKTAQVTVTPAAQPTVYRAAVERKIDSLKQEQQRMAAEGDEPYGGDVEEGRSEQRMTQIPGEIEKAQQTIQPPTPQPPL